MSVTHQIILSPNPLCVCLNTHQIIRCADTLHQLISLWMNSQYPCYLSMARFTAVVVSGKQWVIYDVGGSRTSVRFHTPRFVFLTWYPSQRSAWLPYFDDAHAVLFLAPISCFDEHLTEDPRVNRLQDSIVLWTSIVSSKLLRRTSIICEWALVRPKSSFAQFLSI